MRTYRVALAFLPVLSVLILPLSAEGVRPKDVREIAKAGSSSLPKLQEFLGGGVRVRV